MAEELGLSLRWATATVERERDGEPLVQLGHDKVGTEHLLLGLIREGEGVAAQVLVELGADLFTVRQRVSTS